LATITIHTEYRRYNPPEWVDPTVRRLLDSVSVQLTDLGAIVLTERIVATTRKGSRVMRRNKRGTPLGVYHPAWNGKPAWIEIVVDDIVAELSDWPLANWQFARDGAVGRVLFHEIGHHLDARIGAEARSGEPAAEAWAQSLFRQHVRRHYRYMRPLKPVFALFARFARFMTARKRAQRQLGKSTNS
jgi:hypothetical protein